MGIFEFNKQEYYIRFGALPPYEKSGIWKADKLIGYEDGVSVYNCQKIDNKYNLVLPVPISSQSLYTLYNFIIHDRRNVYLVQGTKVGVGTDKEPIIKNVKIIKEITKEIYGLV